MSEEMRRCSNCGDYTKPDELFCQSCGAAIVSNNPKTTPNTIGYQSSKPSPAIHPSRGSYDNIKSYTQILGTIEIVFGIFALIFGILLGVFSFFVPNLIEYENEINAGYDSGVPTELSGFFVILFLVFAIMMLIYAYVAITSGIRCLQYKNKGRIGTLIIGAVSLIMIPFGTIFGVAVLYVFTRPEIDEIFT
ncbi:MAG: hypothetical protein ACXAC7_15125 [Candidatus Hodarchaeales archaeon]|jgi:hypothetical protein